MVFVESHCHTAPRGVGVGQAGTGDGLGRLGWFGFSDTCKDDPRSHLLWWFIQDLKQIPWPWLRTAE